MGKEQAMGELACAAVNSLGMSSHLLLLFRSDILHLLLLWLLHVWLHLVDRLADRHPVLLLRGHDLGLVRSHRGRSALRSLVGELLRLEELRLPVGGGLHLLRGNDCHGRLHDLDRLGDDSAFTNLVPGFVLHKELKDVVDADQLALERCREGMEHWVLIRMHLGFQAVINQLILCGDIQLKSAVDFLTCSTTRILHGEEIINLFVMIVSTIIIGTVVAEQLELEVLHILTTVGVVTDDADHCFLSKIELVLGVHDL